MVSDRGLGGVLARSRLTLRTHSPRPSSVATTPLGPTTHNPATPLSRSVSSSSSCPRHRGSRARSTRGGSLLCGAPGPARAARSKKQVRVPSAQIRVPTAVFFSAFFLGVCSWSECPAVVCLAQSFLGLSARPTSSASWCCNSSLPSALLSGALPLAGPSFFLEGRLQRFPV